MIAIETSEVSVVFSNEWASNVEASEQGGDEDVQ